ncbi:galactosylceramide sulfotransferase-like [Saccoglossus kowalevskii]|uniref:Galactosylceramide sulfotransferase-like n=1 Tax=Saccoglossus kowalevskii TaxID=10224 RepID=A0ABM0GV73_SACKO|nr:PREDICTED: galactosylceramide sulfotransferase-like [Saccoglossus kowalevskii]
MNFYGDTENNSTTQCKPVSRFIFIKTMKTGGSTTANMLVRYGIKYQLYTSRYNIGHYTCTNLTGIDFMAMHLRYNRTWMDGIIPDAKYLTILRSPYSQLPSAFYFFNFARPLLNYTDPFRQYIENTDNYTHFTDKHHQHRNGQMWFLNSRFDEGEQDNETSIKLAIQRIDKEIDFAIILEHYDESLVVLKQMMCWDYNDIIYYITKKSSERNPVTTAMKKNIRAWNRADMLLYEHFNHSLWERISNYQGDFKEDLRRFREINKNATRPCLRDKNYVIKDSFCWRLLSDTPKLRHFAIVNQKSRNLTEELKQKCQLL